jgi:prevent-host-death family protein
MGIGNGQMMAWPARTCSCHVLANRAGRANFKLALVPRECHDHHGHPDHRRWHITPNPAWTVAQAKAKFSQVIERARSGPQTITRNGRPAAVVVSAEEWERRTSRTGTLAEFLAASPLRGSGLDAERSKDGPRDIEL